MFATLSYRRYSGTWRSTRGSAIAGSWGVRGVASPDSIIPDLAMVRRSSIYFCGNTLIILCNKSTSHQSLNSCTQLQFSGVYLSSVSRHNCMQLFNAIYTSLSSTELNLIFCFLICYWSTIRWANMCMKVSLYVSKSLFKTIVFDIEQSGCHQSCSESRQNTTVVETHLQTGILSPVRAHTNGNTANTQPTALKIFHGPPAVHGRVRRLVSMTHLVTQNERYHPMTSVTEIHDLSICVDQFVDMICLGQESGIRQSDT